MESTKILIVEDESIVAVELKSSLEKMGYQVSGLIDNGAEAIHHVETHHPEIVLMDIRIRGKIDGIETADIIRNRFGIPVVFTTAYLDEEKLNRAKLTMPFGYILKPIQDRDLRVTIDMALYAGKADRDRKIAEEQLRLNESRLEALVDLGQMSSDSIKDITDFALEEAVRLTSSKIGYLAFADEDESILTMYSWSQSAMAECKVENLVREFPIETTGLWAEAIRQRKPVITNDYQAPNPLKKGLPKGHVGIKCHMNIPVFDEKKIVAVAGVGNKDGDYDHADVQQLRLLMQGMWRLVQRKLSEKKVKESEEKYRQIFENAQAPYIESALDGTILEVSPSVNRYLDYSREELIGTSILDLYADSEIRQRFVEKLLKFGEIIDEEVRVKSRDGSIRHAMLCSKYIPEEHKIIGSLQDITARKRAEKALQKALDELEKQVDLRTQELKEVNRVLRNKIREHQHAENALQHSEAKFRSLVETTSDWIWEIDDNFKYIYSSPSVHDLIGYDAAEIYGKTPFDLMIPQEKNKREADFLEISGSGRRFFRFESTVKHKDGHELILESSGVAVLDDNDRIKGYRGIVRDITQRKTFEEQLKVSQEKAEAANAAKSQFLANISHELRTPMHHILNYSKYGAEKIDKVEKEKLLHYFSQIRISGGRLLSLLNDLLDLSKLESGHTRYEFKECDLIAVAERIILEFKVSAQEKRIRFKLVTRYTPTVALCDEMKIEQVFRNLLSNALRFTPSGRSISLLFDRDMLPVDQSRSDENNVPAAAVRIVDEGTGIPEDELEIIFDKFIQSSRTRSNAGGTGLGLSICHEIVKAHRGQIWAENNPDAGATFCFVLPLNQDAK